MAKYTLGLVGCGARGKLNAHAAKEVEDIEVISLTDLNTENAENVKETYSFTNAKIYSSEDDMLAAKVPDIVIICLWTGLHLEAYKKCAYAGVKAVFMEKPMAPTWAECREIARITEETGCQLSFSHQRRFQPGNIAVKQYIADGLIGKILRVDMVSPPNLLDCGTHSVDQALNFLDGKPVKWVLGSLDASETVNFFGVSAEKTFTGTIIWEDNIIGNIYTGFSDIDIWTGVRIFGEKGFFEVEWDGQISRYAIYGQPDWKPEEFEKVEDIDLIRCLQHVCDCLEDGSESTLSYKHAYQATEILFALYESVRERRIIHLPLEGVDDNPFMTMLENHEFHYEDFDKTKSDNEKKE